MGSEVSDVGGLRHGIDHQIGIVRLHQQVVHPTARDHFFFIGFFFVGLFWVAPLRTTT